LTCHDRADGDDVIRIGSVTHPEEEAQQHQREGRNHAGPSRTIGRQTMVTLRRLGPGGGENGLHGERILHGGDDPQPAATRRRARTEPPVGTICQDSRY